MTSDNSGQSGLVTTSIFEPFNLVLLTNFRCYPKMPGTCKSHRKPLFQWERAATGKGRERVEKDGQEKAWKAGRERGRERKVSCHNDRRDSKEHVVGRKRERGRMRWGREKEREGARKGGKQAGVCLYGRGGYHRAVRDWWIGLWMGREVLVVSSN